MPSRLWTAAALLLVAIIIVGGLTIWSRCSPGLPIEISQPPDEEHEGSIFIGGAVTNPGLYPLTGSDSIDALIAAAGGTTENADLTGLTLVVPEQDQAQQPQSVNINRAEAWLLEALPGIGPTRAQAIIDYRQAHGPFRSTDELTRVEGIGTATYEQVRHLITVAD